MTCPPRQTLAALLDDGLNPEERLQVASHLETCSDCRTWLDRCLEDGPLRAQLLSSASTDFLASQEPAPVSRGRVDFLAPSEVADELGTLENYRILSVLGQGGMGIVLRAFDPQLDRTVALKVLRTDRLDDESRRRFVREGRALAQVRHDHVVNVYSVADPPGGPPYLAMECLSGPTLAERIAEVRHLAPGDAADIVMQVASGLHAAHQAGLVHRDIKPGNILFDAVSGRWKLTDFGLAQHSLAANPVTQTATLAGTPAYMSPEQVQGSRRLDARSDVYSLGLTLYESLTGEVPFRGALHLILQQILRDEPRPPGQIQEGIPRDLETICRKAIAKDPSRRYDSAASFAADLGRWLRREPIQARPTAWWEYAAGWIRRNRMVAALAGSLAVVVLFANVGLWKLWRTAEANARRERLQLAETERQKTEAQEQRAEAQASLDDALSAVSQLAETVIDDDLLKQPQLVDLRRRLARRWAEQCQQILEHRADNPQVLSALAEGRMRIATTLAHASTRSEGLTEWTEAVELLTRLKALQPSDNSVDERLAKALMQRGQLLTELAHFDAARRSLEAARELCTALRDREPGNSQRTAQLIAIQGGLARVASMTGDHATAAAILGAVRNEFQRLSEQHPNDVLYRQNLGVAEHNLAMALQETGADFETVVDAYSRAAAVRRRVLQSPDESSSWDKNNLANTYSAHSLYLARQGDLTGAAGLMQQAVGLREQATAETPGGTRYQFLLTGDCIELAAQLELLDRKMESDLLIDRSFELVRQLLTTEPEFYTSGWANHVERLGDLAIRGRQVEPALSVTNMLVEAMKHPGMIEEADRVRQSYQVRVWSRRAALSAIAGDWSGAKEDLEHALRERRAIGDDADDGPSEQVPLLSLRVRLAQSLWHLGEQSAAVDALPTAGELEAALPQVSGDVAWQAMRDDVDFQKFVDQRLGSATRL